MKTIDPETNQKYAFLDETDKIGQGEKQALKLCKQINADTLIADDKEARRIARLLRIKPIGTCGILIQAHKKGLISTNQAQQTLDNLIKAEFGIDPTVYHLIVSELSKTQPQEGLAKPKHWEQKTQQKESTKPYTTHKPQLPIPLTPTKVKRELDLHIGRSKFFRVHQSKPLFSSPFVRQTISTHRQNYNKPTKLLSKTPTAKQIYRLS